MPPDGEGGDRVAIREATPGDFRAVSDLFEEVDRPHREHLPDLFREARGVPREESYINELIAKPDAAVFVAEAGTGVVGLLVVKIHSTPDVSILVPLDYVVIDTIVVTTDARRRGVGRALMVQAEAWARAQGLDRIELNVFEFNEGAINLYHGLGYATLSRRMVKRFNADA